MSVQRESGQLVVLLPARMSRADEKRLVPPLVSRFMAKEAVRRLPAPDSELQHRAEALFDRHLASSSIGQPAFTIRWSGRQQKRWGSCTSATGQIRISDRVRAMPSWVGDFVIVHELAHLLETAHNRRFRELEASYPHAERARGFLEGWAAAAGLEQQFDY